VNITLAGQGKALARRGFIVQVITAVCLVVFVAVMFNRHSAMSAAAGALISILPTSVFSWFAFRYSGARKNALVAKSFSQGSKMKLALTIILFVVTFAGLNAAPIEVFLAYVVTTASHGLAMFHYGTKNNEN